MSVGILESMQVDFHHGCWRAPGVFQYYLPGTARKLFKGLNHEFVLLFDLRLTQLDRIKVKQAYALAVIETVVLPRKLQHRPIQRDATLACTGQFTERSRFLIRPFFLRRRNKDRERGCIFRPITVLLARNEGLRITCLNSIFPTSWKKVCLLFRAFDHSRFETCMRSRSTMDPRI